MKPKTLFLVWQDSQSRRWFPVGRFRYDGELYEFVYIQGALEANKLAGFQPLLTFPRLEQVYQSKALFPFFDNRIMPGTRPEYSQVIEWLDIQENTNDPLVFLARTGGQRVTDAFELFASPEPEEDGMYKFHFLVHGLRYLPESAIARIQRLERGEQLLIAADRQNPYEKNALILRTRDNHLAGFCPAYLLDDADLLLESSDNCQVTVERVNPAHVPLQFRLHCRLTARWPNAFIPFSGTIYQPIVAGAVETDGALAA